MKTVVIQSFRQRDVPAWVDSCMSSVRAWAGRQGFDYHFIGDEIFDLVPGWFVDKAAGRVSIGTDLGRLRLARNFIDQGYGRTVWLDAAALVFDPAGFNIAVTEGCAFGREVWIQQNDRGRL